MTLNYRSTARPVLPGRQTGVSFPVFLLILALAAGFVLYSSLQMPALVGSHFAASGAADSFMSRGRYLALMLCVTIVLPLLVTLPVSLGLDNPNLPNRDYWLAPERREETIAFVRQQMMRFGVALLLFICYAHWLVTRANEHSPPALSVVSLVSGLLMFAAYAVIWIALYFTRFRHVPK